MTPTVRFAGGRRWALSLASAAIVAVWVFRHAELAEHGAVLAGAWMLFLAFLVWHLALAWTARPVDGTSRQQRTLDKLFVTVSVPVLQRGPGYGPARGLPRCSPRTRLPDRIQVVDDGSPQYDYTDVVFMRSSQARCLLPRRLTLSWTRSPQRRQAPRPGGRRSRTVARQMSS